MTGEIEHGEGDEVHGVLAAQSQQRLPCGRLVQRVTGHRQETLNRRQKRVHPQTIQILVEKSVDGLGGLRGAGVEGPVRAVDQRLARRALVEILKQQERCEGDQ